MSDKIKKLLRIPGYKVYRTYRPETGVYEIRKQIGGIKIYASSTDKSEAKRKFIERLHQLFEQPQPVQKVLYAPSEPAVPRRYVCEYALQFLETVKKPNIKQTTYEHYEQLYYAYVVPCFRGKFLDEITRQDCQELINGYLEKGKNRTAQKLYQFCKSIFDYAADDGLIKKSPFNRVVLPPREQVHGQAFTKTEELVFIEKLQAGKCCTEVKQALIVLLYTGIRRSELAGIKLDGEFISVICSKMRKGRNERRRLIPVTPMLKKYLSGIDFAKLQTLRPDALTQAVKRLMPNHHCHELRHTFISRCKECGVQPEVVSVWAGHSLGTTITATVYTHFSNEFMLKEAEKVRY